MTFEITKFNLLYAINFILSVQVKNIIIIHTHLYTNIKKHLFIYLYIYLYIISIKYFYTKLQQLRLQVLSATTERHGAKVHRTVYCGPRYSGSTVFSKINKSPPKNIYLFIDVCKRGVGKFAKSWICLRLSLPRCSIKFLKSSFWIIAAPLSSINIFSA